MSGYHLARQDPVVALRLWFELEDTLLENSSLDERWRVYVAEFRLLLDTFTDDLLPSHRRTLCLDNITRPLAELKRLASQDDRHSELQRLMHELRVVSHFFCPA